MASPFEGMRGEDTFGLMGRLDTEGNNDRGVASPSPAPTMATPAAPSQGVIPLVPSELQGIIDEIKGISVSPGRKIRALTSVAGVVGGLEQTRQTLAQRNLQLGVGEAGATERAKIGITPQMEELKRKNTLMPALPAKPLTEGGEEKEVPFWEKFKTL